MPTAVQSISVPLEISTDGVTFKSLICVEGYTVTNTSPTNDVDTQCGRYVGLGIEGVEITGNGVIGMFPTAGQLDYNDITTLQAGQTLIWYRIQWPTTGSIGVYFKQTQQALITVTAAQNQTGQVFRFSFTIKGVGTRNLTPGQV